MSDFKKKKNKYVDPKLDGRMFPSWVLANYKKYKLDDMVKTDEDPCSRKSKLELRKYQQFLTKYMDFNSPFKNILVYHGLGSGKTVSAINIYNMLYNYTPGWNVYILIKATLKDHPWKSDLEIWLNEQEKKFRNANIIWISYDSPIADKSFFDEVKKADTSKKSLYLVDEAHNFIRNVYSNVSTRQGRRALAIYEHMIQDQKDNDGTRIVLLSGTPAINSPYELALLFNLLRPGIFPKSETVFNQEFITNSSYKILNPARKNLFQRRITGLVSYYIGATPDFYASKTVVYVDVEMSKYQEEIYDYFRDIEEKAARKNKAGKSSGSQTYKSYTRQACNFTFPLMGQGMSGELRPRPKAFKVSEKDAQDLVESRSKIESESDKYYNVQFYLDAINNFMKTFDNHLITISNNDTRDKHTLLDDIKIYRKKYNDDYAEFHKNEEKKSGLYMEMHKCSAKMLNIIFNIFKSKGPVLIYSNYVLMEGLEVFKVYLKHFGFTSLDSKKSGVDDFRYTEYHGGIDSKQRGMNLEMYKSIENKYGAICKIMMISPAGAEGISLYNVRQVHLMEPYWHEVRMIQMIGRAIRMCSHKDLPMDERHVDVYRYKSVRGPGNNNAFKDIMTTDQYIENMARSKEGLIQSFLDATKEAAVDCVLNQPHNSLAHEYKCFQFDEQSLFDEQIGPAYKDDMHDDMKMDNGSNSLRSETVRIKVSKITAVKLLTKADEKIARYSKTENYWYNPETGVVYDYDLHYPIGKIGYDNGLPKKLDKDTYIIELLIPIPMIEDKH